MTLTPADACNCLVVLCGSQLLEIPNSIHRNDDLPEMLAACQMREGYASLLKWKFPIDHRFYAMQVNGIDYSL